MQRCPYLHEMRERFFNEQPITTTTNPPKQPTPIILPPSKFYSAPVSKQQTLPPITAPVITTITSLSAANTTTTNTSATSHTNTTTTATNMPIRGSNIDRESEREGLIDARQSAALSGASSNQVGTVVKVGAKYSRLEQQTDIQAFI